MQKERILELLKNGVHYTLRWWILRYAIEKQVAKMLKECTWTEIDLTIGIMETLKNCGYVEVVKLLLEVGVDVAEDNNLLIRVASEKGNAEVVKLLIEAGADATTHNDYAFLIAIENGNRDIMKILIEADIDFTASRNFLFREVLGNGYLEIAQLMIDKFLRQKRGSFILKKSTISISVGTIQMRKRDYLLSIPFSLLFKY